MKIKRTHGKPRFLVGIFAATIALVALTVGGIVAFSAGDAAAPATSKTLTSNGDGTYNLNLSVTGAASSSTTRTKANVVIVMDTSGSMNFNVVSATGRYGSWATDGDTRGDNKFRLYKRVNGQYSALADDTYTGTVYYYAQGFRQYTGTRYSVQTRLDVAKSATTGLVNTLASNNTSATDDTVEITFETFSYYTNTGAQTYGTWYKGNDMSALTGAIMSNGLTADGATNWDDALHDARATAAAKNDGNPTYFIFVSDGNPTCYMNTDHTGGYHGDGGESSQNIANSYLPAATEAGYINTAGYKFYGVGVFGSVDRMQSLSTAAGGSYYSATDQTTLNQAFASIISSITSSSNFEGVTITDGITAGTSTVVLQEGAKATDYSYTITAPDGTVHHIVLNEDGTIATVDNGTDSVTLTDLAGNTLQLTPGQAFPGATKSGNGVQWDLSSLGTLLGGYTYTVSFRVWPSQTAYDTVAALQNGTLDWANVDQSQYTRTQNTDGSYSYSLKTNTEAKVDYTAVKKVGDQTTSTKGEATFNDVVSAGRL